MSVKIGPDGRAVISSYPWDTDNPLAYRINSQIDDANRMNAELHVEWAKEVSNWYDKVAAHGVENAPPAPVPTLLYVFHIDLNDPKNGGRLLQDGLPVGESPKLPPSGMHPTQPGTSDINSQILTGVKAIWQDLQLIKGKLEIK